MAQRLECHMLNGTYSNYYISSEHLAVDEIGYL
jgi:hypothetical protein